MIKALEESPVYHAPYHALSCLYEIIAKLNEQQDAHYLPQSKRNRISGAIKYIENHYSDPNLNIEMLASKSGVSGVYFRKLFSEIYQMPPMKYVQTLRMERARSLLLSGYSSVSDTSRLVGFNSICHFSRVFKQTFGAPPVNFIPRDHGAEK